MTSFRTVVLQSILLLFALPIAALAQAPMSDADMREMMAQRGYGPGMGPGAMGPGPGMMMGGPGGMCPMMMGMMGGGMGGPGMGMMGGPGMMGPGMGMGMGMGMGPGMMMGPGMGMGGGMMGPGMMGPGMMGPGTGMMGGGMGPGGMGMGAHPFAMFDLTDDQRAKLSKIQDETRKRQWDLMGKLFDEQARLRDVYATERPDPKQVGQAYGNMAKIQQQMAEIATDAHNRMFDVLTKEQRDQLQQMRRGMMGPGSMGRGGAAPSRPQMMR